MAVTVTGESLPILYSFRRCPYAIRARMAILASGITVELREVVLRNKPPQLLAASRKATVPVLVLSDGRVIDESLDVMLWASRQHDPAGLLSPPAADLSDMLALIDACETTFKPLLDAYKYARQDAPEAGVRARTEAGGFLSVLDRRLAVTPYLFGERAALGDMAILPFVRQFALVDKAWFDAGPWPCLAVWLDAMLADASFTGVMGKWRPWEAGQAPVLFGPGYAAS